MHSATLTVTSSVRGLTHSASSYDEAQSAARSLAEAEAMYLAGMPQWWLYAAIERMHNVDGNCTGYRVLRRPTGPLAAHITPTEVIAVVGIAADWAAIQAEREAAARQIQIEQVRSWLASGVEVPADYPVQPGDLPEAQQPAPARPTCEGDVSPCVDCNSGPAPEPDLWRAEAQLDDAGGAPAIPAEECRGSVAYSLTRRQIRVFWCDGRDVKQGARLYPRTAKGRAAAERCMARKTREGYRNVGQWEREDALRQLVEAARAEAPAPVLPIAAGSRVEVAFGPDAGCVGTVVRGPDPSGYYSVSLDGRARDAWGPYWYYLAHEIRPSTAPPPVERPWANDAAYAAEGRRVE